MSADRPPEHRDRYLDDIDEVAEFVRRLSLDIAQDGRMHLYFETLAHVNWQAHTLDHGWSGPNTERARQRGHGLAWAMAHRLMGPERGVPLRVAPGPTSQPREATRGAGG